MQRMSAMEAGTCSVCLESLKKIGRDRNPAAHKFADLLDFQFPDDHPVCYVCSHLMVKMARFRNMCVERHSHLLDYCTQNNDTYSRSTGTYKHSFVTTDISVHKFCPFIECENDTNLNADPLSHIQDSDQYPHNIDYGYVTAIISHTCKRVGTDDSVADLSYVDNNSDNTSNSKIVRNKSNDDKYSVNLEDYDSDIANSNNFESNLTQNDVDPEMQNDGEELLNEEDIDEQKPFFEKSVLSMEKQKGELDALRKEKKYLEAVYKCYSCALGFVLKDSYQSHMVRHEESNGAYCCGVCGLRFANVGVRSMHVALHSERYRCSRCGDAVKRPRRAQHAARCWRDETASCHLCGKLFVDATRLQQHLRRLHAERPRRRYACQQCNKVYRDSASLRVHTITHSGERFPCARCPSVFGTPYALSRHAAAHAARQPLYCEPCGAWFKSRKTYRAHVRTAAAHRTDSYECGACGRAFGTRVALASHARARHERGARAAHACGACPARYATRASLARHACAHAAAGAAERAVCHQCGKSYKNKNKLKRHLREVCEPKDSEDFDD